MTSNKPSEYKIAIFSAFIGIVFTAIYDFIKDKPILSSFFSICQWIWTNIFEFKIKIWLLLLFLTTIYLIKRFYNYKTKTPNKADWLNYEEDTIDGIKWKWIWYKNPMSGNWTISDLKIVCNKCETSMDMNESYPYDYAECPRCDNRKERYRSLQKIEAIIIDNVQRGLYKSLI